MDLKDRFCIEAKAIDQKEYSMIKGGTTREHTPCCAILVQILSGLHCFIHHKAHYMHR
jgi:hypothetical protein